MKIVFISSEGEAVSRMVRRSSVRSAKIVEFREASVEEALQFLEERLGEAKFQEKKEDLVDLVKNYTGGKFTALIDVATEIHDLTCSYHAILCTSFVPFVCHI
jgi:hypothetical protein